MPQSPTSPFLTQSAATVAATIRSGTRTAAQYANDLITHAEQWKDLNAFITFRPEQLLKDAAAVDAAIARGDPVGPLAGLPFVVKDCLDTAAYPTTSGTPSLKDYQPARNAIVVQRLLDAGAIIAGKT